MSDTWRRGGASAFPGRSAPALEMKLGALAMLLSVTLLFGWAPLCLARGAGGAGRCGLDPGRRGRLLGLISCFAGGVFLATCLLDLLPDFLQSIGQAFGAAGVTLQFPLPEFIVAMGFFLVLVLEQVVLALKEQSRHRAEERRALLGEPPAQAAAAHQQQQQQQQAAEEGSRSALRALILVLSLSLHSVLEGLAVGLLEEGGQVLEVCLALVIHKSIVAFSLAVRLTAGRLRRAAAAGYLLLFALTSPLGIALGVGLSQTRASPQHQLARSTLEGLATGTFFYITFMEILPHELAAGGGRGGGRIPKVAALLLGFAVVTAVLFVKL